MDHKQAVKDADRAWRLAKGIKDEPAPLPPEVKLAVIEAGGPPTPIVPEMPIEAKAKDGFFKRLFGKKR